MSRGNHRNRSVKGNARKRLLRGETHGMAVFLSEHSLDGKDPVTGERLVPIKDLERLAAFLGVADPALDQPEQTPAQRRHKLVRAIHREEKRLATCPRAERWNESPLRRRQERVEHDSTEQ